ncbi:MFS transporter [Streptomyces sp. NPDC093510]|uniref:MFS transporter n=1 Tax=Streptomyces sp. NPDC093510 TaxID=3155199 RepID=UPI0034333617
MTVRPARQLAGGYRDLVRVPGFWRIAGLGMASKLPAGMTALSLLLLVGRDHAYGTAGLAVSCLAIGQGATGPLRGRLVDRRSPRVVLLCCLAGHLTALALLILTVYAHGSAATMLVLAVCAGATAPPVAVMMRTVWHPLTDSRTLATAMALDSAMMGTALITGPVLASWLSLSFSAAVPFAVIAALTTCVVVLLLRSLSGRPGRDEAGAGVTARDEAARDEAARDDTGQAGSSRTQGDRLRPLASAPLRRLLAANGLFVAAVTAADVVLPIYAKEHGAAPYTGLYLAALSIGSVLGSLALGAAPSMLSRGPRVSLLLCALAVGAGALAVAARFSPTAVLAVCPVAGLVIGATFGALRTLGGDLAPAGRVTETMSWLASLDTAGAALGAAAVAQLAGARGSGTALLLVPTAAVLAAIVGRRAHATAPATPVGRAGAPVRDAAPDRAREPHRT